MKWTTFFIMMVLVLGCTKKIIKLPDPMPETHKPVVVPEKKPEACDIIEQTSEIDSRTMIKEILYFDFDSHVLRPESFLLLDQLAKEIQDRQVLIDGHACEIGTEDYNQELSTSRAVTVLKYLEMQRGDFMNYTQGKGESDPVSSDLKLNRRVEITIKG